MKTKERLLKSASGLLITSLMLVTGCDVVNDSEPSNSFKGVWNRTSGSQTTAIAIGCVMNENSDFIYMCEWDTPYPDDYYGTIDLSSGEISWESPAEYTQYLYKAEVSGSTLNLYAFVNGSFVSAGTYTKGSWPDSRCGLVQSGDQVVRESSGSKHFVINASSIYNTSNPNGYNTQSVANYRSSNTINIGKIYIIADYQGSQTISLYHSDGPGSVFATWNISLNQEFYLTYQGQEIAFGNDWGIQITFANGVQSDINFVGDVSSFISN
jgi:hypothetical protein